MYDRYSGLLIFIISILEVLLTIISCWQLHLLCN